MTNFSFELDAGLLKAAHVCASTEETRYYLRGVLIEPQGDQVCVVSTDGHRLFAARYEPLREVGNVLAQENFLIPSDVIKRALVGFKAETIHLRREGDTWFLGDLTFQPIDGTFPAWDRVFPSTQTIVESLGTVAQFNPAYVADLAKVSKALNGTVRNAPTPAIHHCGQNPATVTFEGFPHVACLIMPKREETLPAEDLAARVDWIRAEPQANSAAA